MITLHTEKDVELQRIKEKFDLDVEVITDNEVQFLLEYIDILKRDNEILFNMVINADGVIV